MTTAVRTATGDQQSGASGPEDGGFPLVLRNFNKERFILAVDCNRKARVCLSEALRHAHDRETFS